MSCQPERGAEADPLACYCFEIPAREVNAETVTYVQRRVAAKECDCRRLNPSGKCCLPGLRRIVAAAEGGGPS